MKKNCILFITLIINSALLVGAQNIQNNPGSNHGNRFEQLGTILPTPNEYRTASGAPGPKYWQQRCDYAIQCELDEIQKKLTGKEQITYYNNSPDELRYLWLQLDENQHSRKNNAGYQESSRFQQRITEAGADQIVGKKDNEYGLNITSVTDEMGRKLTYFINKTMMRVELPRPLKPGQQFKFSVEWNYFLIDRNKYSGRGGYEHFAADGNDLFTITQWYPRLCVYSDFQGWQNHQFTGTGEFALTFGNFRVSITVPSDHVVMATGQCQNYEKVLSTQEMSRWQKAQTAKDVVEIVTLNEAKAKEKKKQPGKKTWIFKADMVRDFAWGSSRKFTWDAMPAYVEGKKVMCMSAYPKEAYNLYRRYSTKVVAHTIKSYSHFTIPYPYPVAQSIEASNGMEYPMICFNYGRCEPDGTYSEATKNGMIGVVIHEVGHNFFPMIVNSDERQWTWMDEGLNSFCEFLTEQLFDNKFPSRRGPAYKIVDYMKLPKDQLEPIMTNSEDINQFGNNAYGKPATGLNILRETIMGRDLFDYAFKEYARRWAFKHPTPADFFRTMEDASAEDLDWFWRGWFYGTEPCDISLDSVKWGKIDTANLAHSPQSHSRKVKIAPPMVDQIDNISAFRNRMDKNIVFATNADTSLRDFYWYYDRNLVKIDTRPIETESDRGSEPASTHEINNFAYPYQYELSFSNKGGMVMPIIIEWTFTDNTTQIDRITVYIWRKDEYYVTKNFLLPKEVKSIQIDPYRETADINEENNVWPTTTTQSSFQLFKKKLAVPRGAAAGNPNPMQRVTP